MKSPTKAVRRPRAPRAPSPVARWLQTNGHTQKWLAEKLGVTAAYVAMIAAGSRTPSLGVAKRLQAITGIPAIDFVSSAVA